MSQAGSENFPMDSSGQTINDDTHFLETWEVSQTDQNLEKLTTDILYIGRVPKALVV